MKSSYKTYQQLNLPALDSAVLDFWKNEKIFEKSVTQREGKPTFVFYEGPPSANGLPGIHHVMSRTLKDLFCRYKTLKGFQVHRKGGWDTHGLPVELSVEKKLGITKEDIGTKISVEQYNEECRKEVMRYKDRWDDLTTKMGYWLDLDQPYITFDNNYIESLWHLLKKLYNKGLLYKGYSIQPFSPAAGTGLSTHELNQPGSYRNVKDTTATAQFKIKDKEEYFLAWTTTPWTLPSNTALAVGKNITYLRVSTFNPYTHQSIKVILAKELLSKYFKAENAELSLEDYKAGDKNIPYKIEGEIKGSELEGMRYEQLLPYAQPEDGDAFKVILGDFVTTEDGTGIVHIAPSFGADDLRVAKMNGIGSLTLVDRQGKFVDEVTDFAGRYVKNYKNEEDYKSVDIDIAVHLKKNNRAFKVEKHEHSYPHCWRTDKPVIYYPLDAWFIKVTACKNEMIELNKTINWKPAATGTGRFGNWLENLQDWNLSRSRFWGTPLPIWRTEDGTEEICIGSIEELRNEVDKAVEKGFMKTSLSDDFDFHKPYVDRIVLSSSSGKKMFREPDLIDVWFDSGAMPYAQWHYPFENAEIFGKNFPADFIAEGVDQTRGWFYTLHALAVMAYGSVAYKTVISNGLLQDKLGRKMSKRLGNGIDPFETLAKYGADATRWYMITASQPWDNLKFDIAGLQEVVRKFMGTLYNTYSFFALYANIDGFTYEASREIAVNDRPEIDRWIISKLNSLVAEVDRQFADYEPTRACRLISSFVLDHLSNWYVRLCRKRFWNPSAIDRGQSKDKLAAYQTLYTCLETVLQLIAPVCPMISDELFRNLEEVSGRRNVESVHLSDFPEAEEAAIDRGLEERMALAQNISSMVLALRKKASIKVRQPLQKVLIPVLDERQKNQLLQVEGLIKTEVNIKEVEYVSGDTNIISKYVKPDFKILGKKLGRYVKDAQQALKDLSQEQISQFEKEGSFSLNLGGEPFEIGLEEVEIFTKDIEGWMVNHQNGITVALDVQITDVLRSEGYAREIVNKLQRLRKDKNFDVTDKIKVLVQQNDELNAAIELHKDYICKETLTEQLQFSSLLQGGEEVDINSIPLTLELHKLN